jgi:DNA modification methylase
MSTLWEPEGTLFCNDNLERLAQLPSDSVDLIYLDPPFFSNRVYEVIWGDEAEVRSFEDRWEGGIQHYIGWMRERVIEMHRLLKPTGSLYLHCDPHASHYIKVMLDGIFTASMFRSEIIWKRTTAHSDSKQGRRLPGSIHDVIFFYTKSRNWIWNPIFVDYDETYTASHYRFIENGTGRRYRKADLTAAKPGGDTSYEWRGVKPYRGRYWAYTRENMERFEAEGRISYTRRGMPELKLYLDEMPGVALQDVWTDIDAINARAAERLGYPTQKPEALLERIIMAS